MRAPTQFKPGSNPMSYAVPVEVALSGVAWFLAVSWLNFAGGPRLELHVAIVSGMLVMLFTLFLRLASRWRLHRGSRPCSVSHCCG
jgi:hypothetical protein